MTYNNCCPTNNNQGTNIEYHNVKRCEYNETNICTEIKPLSSIQLRCPGICPRAVCLSRMRRCIMPYLRCMVDPNTYFTWMLARLY